MPTRGWYIDTWAGEPTENVASFDHCARFNFLRRTLKGNIQRPNETPSGRFVYGTDACPKLQPRVAILSGALQNRGLTRFQRLGEGAEAFVVSTTDRASHEAVRVAQTKVHTTPDPDRLPCTEMFTITSPGDGRAFNVTIAPVVQQDVTEDEIWNFKRHQFERGNMCAPDYIALNFGRYNGRVVVIDYGIAMQPWTDPQLGAWSYAADLLFKTCQRPELAEKPVIKTFATQLVAGIAPHRHKDLELLAQSAPKKRARLFG